ncbi:MAG TPA: hypothetical protein VIM74_06460, partial [Casimicrobiaceae bacterium]
FLAWSKDGGQTWKPFKVPTMKIGDEPARRYDFNGEAPINVSADGSIFIVGMPVVAASGDRGKSWFAPEGLPAHARAIADKADPSLFYAIDFMASRLYVSRDSARTFVPMLAAGLPKDFSADRPRNREAQYPLQAVPGKAGELWLLLGGKLYWSTDFGASFRKAGDDDIRIAKFGLGHSAPDRDSPAVYAIATKNGVTGIWRSNDAGSSWSRINDDLHQWGLRFRAISGDPRIYGRVYIATDGRGILYGDPAAPR